MRDKLLQIRVDESFLSKVSYLQRINGFKSVAETVRKTVEKEYEKEKTQGYWIDFRDDGYIECPICHSATNCEDDVNDLHFCFSCGAKLDMPQV